MARLVVLRFEDHDAAQRFVEHMDNRMGAGALNQASIAMAYAEAIRVVAQPVKFCECTRPQKFGKGPKLGWWVHKGCGRPLEKPWGGEKGMRQLLFSARDLLPEMRKRRDTEENDERKDS